MSEPDQFEIIRFEDSFELRYYPSMVIAKVLQTGPFEAAYKAGADILKSYLDGDNHHRVRLSEILPKGSAYMLKSRPDGWEVSCLLQGTHTQEAAPRPVDHRICIEQLTSRPVAVYKFSGKVPYSFVMKKTEELRTWATSSDLRLNSTSKIVIHRPSFLRFRRRSEIQLDGVFF